MNTGYNKMHIIAVWILWKKIIISYYDKLAALCNEKSEQDMHIHWGMGERGTRQHFQWKQALLQLTAKINKTRIGARSPLVIIHITQVYIRTWINITMLMFHQNFVHHNIMLNFVKNFAIQGTFKIKHLYYRI